MQNNISSDNLKYYQEQDKENILKLRAVIDTLPKFCREYFLSIANSKAARTRLGYAYDIRTFFEFLHEQNPTLNKLNIRDFTLNVLDQVTREDIDEYLDYISLYDHEGRELSNELVGKKRKAAAVRSMFNYFFKMDKISHNAPSKIEMPKLKEKPIIRLEPNEIVEMLDVVEEGDKLTDKQKIYHNKTRIRDVAIITLLLGTGIRVSECVGIDLNDLDFENCGISIHRKGGKDSVIYFGDEVRDALMAYLAERNLIVPITGHEKALFLSLQNRRISVRAVENLVKKYAKNVTSLKKITPHKLRSTYGTNLYRETGDIYLVADVLGHSDINTTRKHYADQSDENRRRAARIVRLRENN
ncbi:tyrosine-type recombinase/integrase [Butyrivibrio sp. MC2013]|uniref:tyrosine-type recombinase/integrase n=1 Tax=Butyrivibrio sp. MC2013 TaxID=1280686 RepID=UPI000403488D|nr:tyrosine-type recombinase/integrase [Butyrivibrio sp. MC2013]